jgi:hypothetical protein
MNPETATGRRGRDRPARVRLPCPTVRERKSRFFRVGPVYRPGGNRPTESGRSAGYRFACAARRLGRRPR